MHEIVPAHPRCGLCPIIRLFVLLAFVLTASVDASAESVAWKTVADGVSFVRLTPSGYSGLNAPDFSVLKVDPAKKTLKVLTAKEHGRRNRSALQWCREFGCIAAINAGMFQEDYLTNVGYMEFSGTTNNGMIHRSYMSALAFDPISPDEHPPARIFDLDEVPMKELFSKYRSIVQNLRLIKRPGENRWLEHGRSWSEAAVAEDTDGNILFIYCGTPLSMRAFNEILLELPLGIVAAQHVEGGPEATLYVRAPEGEGGGFTGFPASRLSPHAWPIPNVLVVMP